MKLYLNVKEVSERYGVDTCTVWRWRKDANRGFPEPHRFGPQTLRWKIADLDAWDHHVKGDAA